MNALLVADLVVEAGSCGVLRAAVTAPAVPASPVRDGAARSPQPPDDRWGCGVPVDLDVPPGQVLLLLAGEWYPERDRAAGRDILVSVVAVSRQVTDGLVFTHAHACDHRHPDCGRHHCWEAYVVVAAIRACLAGAR